MGEADGQTDETRIFVAIAKIQTSLVDIQKTVTATDERIRGNGKEGLLERVGVIEKDNVRREWWSKTAIVIALGAIVTVVIDAIRQ